MLSYSDELVDILQRIHSADVVHQDLRPDNLMINEDGEFFIIDFDCGEHRMYVHEYIEVYRGHVGFGECSGMAGTR